MGALASNQLAILTARLGAGRLGAIRLGFVPKDTKNAFYVWSRVYPPSGSWTAVNR